LSKSKITVFKKGGQKLKATESWRMNWQNNDEGDSFDCLGVTTESTGGWNKLKTLTKTEGYQALTAVNKCFSNTWYKGTDVRQYI